MPDLGISGLASGFDWHSLVDQLADIERAPQRLLLTEQSTLEQRNDAYAGIATQLGVLSKRVAALNEVSLFNSRITSVSDSTVASATAGAGASLGSYALAVSQLANASVQKGSINAGAALSETSDVSGLVLSSAGFSMAVTAGTFTVNGKTITIATTDTMQGVFDKIGAATSGAVAGSYDADTDKITIAGTGEVVLGSANDTSNFLRAAKLLNNGGQTVTSSASLGGINSSHTLSSANFATALGDGGAGAGQFKINGVEISFNVASDSVADVLQRINDSTAGVTASYDLANDRFQLANKTTGDLGVALEDVTGNFLAATGLSGGTLQRGKDLLFTIDGGGQLSSHSNTISEEASGVAGLSITVFKEGAARVGVASDSSKIKTALNDFVTEFNRTQSLIATQTASTTDAKGKVTAGILAGQSDAYDIASRLRSMANGKLSGLSGALQQLAAFGINSNGDNDNLSLADSTKLDAALASNLSAVRDLFTNTTSGLAVKFASYLDGVIGEEGTLISKQDTLAKQSSGIDVQIVDRERMVQSNRAQLISSFLAMEQAQQRTNQQLSFLQQRFNVSG